MATREAQSKPVRKAAAKHLPSQAGDALDAYKKKRDFTVTPEPAEGGVPGVEALQFVIQKHWASRLHYDLRLEIDGTMKSWAVPKGPSYDPSEKRMAVQVEDHPISYNTFEGQIPANQYGAGRVIIWDRGFWIPVGDPAEGHRKGKLKFEIHGHKMRGHWTLVRVHGRGSDKQPPWLLIKEHDGNELSASDFNLVEEMPDSVVGLDPVQVPRPPAVALASAEVVAKSLDAAPKSTSPLILPPQLATLVDGPPADTSDWLWELKFDGYRILARIEKGKAQLFTRNGHNWTLKMPDLAKAIGQLPVKSAWIDGEVIITDANGIPDFQALQNAFDGKATKDLVFWAFDLPFCNGRDLRGLPNIERREVLESVIGNAGNDRVRFSEAFEASPSELVSSACKLGFEGVIGKRKSGVYVSRRSADWIKLKCTHRQEFVIGGFSDPRGARKGIGSLLLGVHTGDGALQYAGSVGTGFSERVLADLFEKLSALQITKCPFANPKAIEKKAHWVEPTLLAEVAFAEWTKEGKVRHSVFHGLRADKPASKIIREEPAHLSGSTPITSKNKLAANLRVSNPERVIDPSTGTTKINLVRYYATVAPLIIPHLQGRPVSLVRAPQGIDGQQFFQKHLDKGEMKGIGQLPSRLHDGHPPLLEVQKPEGLITASQMNVVEFHTWNARKDLILKPDRMTFDLDPGDGVTWPEMREAAILVQVIIEELGLHPFLKTSGGKGLHVVVPIKRMHDWDTVKGFSEAVVAHLAKTIPQRFVAKMGPRNRVGRIFVDYLRNGFGATTASAWTARARPGMGISVPIKWDELEKITSGSHWSVKTVGQRLRQGNAPWSGYDKSSVTLNRAMKALGYERSER
jgi:bifunctional non-homologous end joining protein LigD